ncbi:uncharacterized protein LOC122547391 [Chiloscyllium plagiosum]|uniref:uncharacterized protein LOC122547391 n=1 Tax=Chiloscyllium plagiosum TaxID=36176 RepID=UPI001CB7AD5F|nr:uncharacterized protein LOC122547391 [Chiloscyllium plagiosum]
MGLNRRQTVLFDKFQLNRCLLKKSRLKATKAQLGKLREKTADASASKTWVLDVQRCSATRVGIQDATEHARYQRAQKMISKVHSLPILFPGSSTHAGMTDNVIENWESRTSPDDTRLGHIRFCNRGGCGRCTSPLREVTFKNSTCWVIFGTVVKKVRKIGSVLNHGNDALQHLQFQKTSYLNQQCCLIGVRRGSMVDTLAPSTCGPKVILPRSSLLFGF